jgi:plastocyanin
MRFLIFLVLTGCLALRTPYTTTARADQALPAPKTVAVDVDNFKFSVAMLEVAVGTTVTWTNHDDVPHTVVSTTKVFKSAPLDTGDSFSFTFKEAGTFAYFCSLHPHMTATVIVK